MAITHIFFDLYGTLVNPDLIQPAYAQQLATILAGRYGGSVEAWTTAYNTVKADWDSYYADLDLTGEHSLDDLWEGLFRTTRALFRLTHTQEPSDLTELSRELPGLAAQGCNALYPDVQPAIQRLSEQGRVLGIVSSLITTHARGLLEGGSILDHFKGPIIGPDSVGHYGLDTSLYRYALEKAGALPDTCLMVQSRLEGLASATAAGVKTLCFRRETLKIGTLDSRGELETDLVHQVND